MKYYIIAYLFLVMCFAQTNLQNIIGQDKCKVCHKKEYTVWSGTKHSTTYESLHTNANALKIMKRLKLKGSTRKQTSCRRCHYTLKPRGSIFRTIGAIACEKCHGPGKDWVNVHNNVKIPQPKRRDMSTEAGMFHPGNIYGIANNCYGCHIIDDEKLVDRGRHPVGNGSFKFVVETQGKMRHNFTSGKGENIPASNERKRLFHVVGQSLEIQYYLRALGNATQQRNYFLVTRKRLQDSVGEMVKIHQALNTKETQYIIKILKGVQAVANNKEQLHKAASEIDKATKLLVKNHKLETMSSIDTLLPK